MSEVKIVKKIVILNPAGKTQNCTKDKCFNFVFAKCDDDKVRCMECLQPIVLEEGNVEGSFPRPGMEYWDRFNQLPSYSFLLDNNNCVRKVPMRSGNWKEGYTVGQLIDEAQSEINSLKARLARLELKAVN